MQSTDSDPVPPDSSLVSPPIDSLGSRTVASDRARLWSLTLGAGILAGLVSWLAGEASRELIKPPRHEVNSRGLTLRVTDRREEAAAVAKNAGLAFVLLGGALGGGLGVAGGLVRRSSRAAMSAGLLGLAVGATATGAMSLVVLPAHTVYQLRYPDEASRNLLWPLLVHTGIWSVVGAAGGWALGLGVGGQNRLGPAVQGGLVGAAIAAIGYEFIGAFALPAARTAQYVSATWQTRLLARLAVTVLAAIGATVAVSSPRQRPATPVA